MIKVINSNLACIGQKVQYNIGGENVVLQFNHENIAETDEKYLEGLRPHGIEKFVKGVTEAFDISKATNEELFNFLKSRSEEYLTNLASESQLPPHEWAHLGKMSLATYLYEKMKKEDDGDNESKKRGGGRPKKEETPNA